jgi:prefoldin subunit 5
MASQFLRIQWCAFFPLFLFLPVSCTLNLELKKPEGEKEFLQETYRLEKIAREDPVESARAKSHLQLAFLYLNSRNPQLDYSRALQEMESYLSMSQGKAQNDSFQNWLAVLKEMDRGRKDMKAIEERNQFLEDQNEKLRFSLEEVDRLRKDMRGIREKNQALRSQIGKLRTSLEKVHEANKNLRDEVGGLQGVIQELKDLDYQMEEKRELIK